MDAEHISKYEAAAMYAYENTTAQTEVTKERNYLILDLEQCSAGFCTCDQKETKLIHNWDTTQTDLWDLCIENLQKLAGEPKENRLFLNWSHSVPRQTISCVIIFFLTAQ